MRQGSPTCSAGPSPAERTVPACRLCGNAAGNRRHAAREMMLGRRDPFGYVECAACGCVQIEAVPANLAAHYGADDSGPAWMESR